MSVVEKIHGYDMCRHLGQVTWGGNMHAYSLIKYRQLYFSPIHIPHRNTPTALFQSYQKDLKDLALKLEVLKVKVLVNFFKFAQVYISTSIINTNIYIFIFQNDFSQNFDKLSGGL